MNDIFLQNHVDLSWRKFNLTQERWQGFCFQECITHDYSSLFLDIHRLEMLPQPCADFFQEGSNI